MSEADYKIRIVVDGSDAKAGAKQVSNALNLLVQDAKKAGSATAKAGEQIKAANDNAKGMARVTTDLTTKFKMLAASAKLVGAAIGAAFALAIGAFMKLSDKFSELTGKLNIATGSAAAFARAQADVIAIAAQTRSDLSSVGDLYTKMAQNAQTLGLNTAGVGVATKTFAMALKVGSASTTEAASAILQLSQAMGSGVLQGDEFKSLMETSPTFMGVLAKSMDVPLSQLKKLGSEGKITGQAIAKALTDPKIVAEIEEKFGKIPTKFSEILQSVGNIALQAAGVLAKSLGIGDSLAVINAQVNEFGQRMIPVVEKIGDGIRSAMNVIVPVAKAIGSVLSPVINNLDLVAKAATSVAAGFIAVKAAGAFTALTAQVVNLGRAFLAAGGFAGLFTTAITVARTAVNAFTASLMANPFTAVITGLTVTLTLLYQFRNDIKVGLGEGVALADYMAEAFSTIGTSLKNAWTTIKSVYSAFKAVDDAIKGLFASFKNNAISNFLTILKVGLGDNLTTALKFADGVKKGFGAAFGFIDGARKKVFGDFSFSLHGLVYLTATVTDLMVGSFQGGLHFISGLIQNLPQVMAAAMGGIANTIISTFEGIINTVLSGLNMVAGFASKLPGVPKIAEAKPVSLGRVNVENPVVGIAAESLGVAAGYRKNRDGANAFAERVRARGAARTNTPAAPNPDSTAAPSAVADAGEKAKEAADKVADFWKGLERARDAAGLVGFELEKHTKTLELEDALGRKINATEAERLNTLLRTTATKKAISDLGQQAADYEAKAALSAKENNLLKTVGAARAAEEMEVESRLADFRRKALEDGVDLNSELVKQGEARLASAIRLNQENEKENRLLKERQALGADLIKRYGREADPRGAALGDYNDRNAAINAAVRPDGVSESEWQKAVTRALEGSAAEYNKAMEDIAQSFRDKMLNSVNAIADAIGGKGGDIIRQVGQLWDMLSKPQTNADGSAGGSMLQALSKPMESLKEGFSGFTDLFKKGGFVKGIEGAIGKMGQGSMIGGIVGGIGSMISKNFSQQGSSIGGMIGGLFGPVGSILGSLGGGILGGIFGGKKVARGSASFSLDEATGQLEVSSSGKHGGEEDAAKLANAVVSGINGIASKLGATLTSNFDLAVGKNGGDWRVNTSGGGVTGKQGTTFKTMEEALAFALKDLISDGILDGISDFSQRYLKNAKNLDSAVALAESYEKLLKNLASMNDPIGSSITEVTDGLDRMVKQMKAAGATSDELGKVQEYRTKKLQEMLKEATSGFTSFRQELFGEGSGVSAMNRLSAAQAEFGKLHQTILSGGTVDQDDFTRTGQSVMDLARSVYGQSSSQFQAIRQMLIGATDGAIENVTKTYDDAMAKAIEAQTQAMLEQQVLTNDLLNQINTGIQQMNAQVATNSGGDYLVARNGSLISQAV